MWCDCGLCVRKGRKKRNVYREEIKKGLPRKKAMDNGGEGKAILPDSKGQEDDLIMTTSCREQQEGEVTMVTERTLITGKGTTAVLEDLRSTRQPTK